MSRFDDYHPALAQAQACGQRPLRTLNRLRGPLGSSMAFNRYRVRTLREMGTAYPTMPVPVQIDTLYLTTGPVPVLGYHLSYDEGEVVTACCQVGVVMSVRMRESRLSQD